MPVRPLVTDSGVYGEGSSTKAEAGRDSAWSLFNTRQQLEEEGAGEKEKSQRVQMRRLAMLYAQDAVHRKAQELQVHRAFQGKALFCSSSEGKEWLEPEASKRGLLDGCLERAPTGSLGFDARQRNGRQV